MAKNQPTENDKIRKQVLSELERLGKVTTGDDSLVFEGTRFVLPENMRGNLNSAVRFLKDYQEQQETHFSFSRTFNYRPEDGANAFDLAMRTMFGTSGLGKSIQTMFGDIPPQLRTINVGPSETKQVPWGRVAFPPLEADFYLGADRHHEYGFVFEVGVEAPRKYRAHIEAFFQVVEEKLKTDSIYRGKAFTGGDEPMFLDTNSVDPDKIVYSEEVRVQLDTNLWSLLRYTDQMRRNNIPLKRAVLVEGPYGTGKSESGRLTAKEAVENGWSFILCRPNRDNLNEVLQTAQLYAPAVVWYEDLDVIGQGHSDQQISRLLDSLDGITAKGVEVLAGFTTNHVDKLQKGVLRPGRLDAVIHVGGLDEAGYEKLVRVTVPEELLGDVDFSTVAVSFKDFLPAFAKEAIDRSMRYAISRNQGSPAPINTEDLVAAADGLRPQLELMNDAQEGVKRSPLEERFSGLFTQALNETTVVDNDGTDDERFLLKHKNENE